MSAVLDVIKPEFPSVAEAFLRLRQEVAAAGPLETKYRELCILAGFAAIGSERGIRTHVHRAVAAGATVEEVKHALLLTLGSSAGLSEVVDAYTWVEQELAQ